jgi:hypothetical protein
MGYDDVLLCRSGRCYRAGFGAGAIMYTAVKNIDSNTAATAILGLAVLAAVIAYLMGWLRF